MHLMTGLGVAGQWVWAGAGGRLVAGAWNRELDQTLIWQALLLPMDPRRPGGEWRELKAVLGCPRSTLT